MGWESAPHTHDGNEGGANEGVDELMASPLRMALERAVHPYVPPGQEVREPINRRLGVVQALLPDVRTCLQTATLNSLAARCKPAIMVSAVR